MTRRVTFSYLYERLHADIVRASFHQHIPGMTQEEVAAEMIVCLWRARRTYRKGHGVTLEQYWWAVWMHRKSDLISYFLSQKRDVRKEVLWDDPSIDSEVEAEIVPPAPTRDEVENQVWAMLAAGHTRKDVLAKLAISKRRYYEIIESWRNAEVRSGLTDETTP